MAVPKKECSNCGSIKPLKRQFQFRLLPNLLIFSLIFLGLVSFLEHETGQPLGASSFFGLLAAFCSPLIILWITWILVTLLRKKNYGKVCSDCCFSVKKNAVVYKGFYCTYCLTHTKYENSGFRHTYWFHLLVALCTFGFWLYPWIASFFFFKREASCVSCAKDIPSLGKPSVFMSLVSYLAVSPIVRVLSITLIICLPIILVANTYEPLFWILDTRYSFENYSFDINKGLDYLAIGEIEYLMPDGNPFFNLDIVFLLLVLVISIISELEYFHGLINLNKRILRKWGYLFSFWCVSFIAILIGINESNELKNMRMQQENILADQWVDDVKTVFEAECLKLKEEAAYYDIEVPNPKYKSWSDREGYELIRKKHENNLDLSDRTSYKFCGKEEVFNQLEKALKKERYTGSACSRGAYEKVDIRGPLDLDRDGFKDSMSVNSWNKNKKSCYTISIESRIFEEFKEGSFQYDVDPSLQRD